MGNSGIDTGLTSLPLYALREETYREGRAVSSIAAGEFTPVCTTEFIAYAKMQPQFAALNTELLGLSIDSNLSHLAWVYAIYLAIGIQIPFPVVADRTGEVARLYGMIAPETSQQETVRNVYFIDPNQIIRAILAYPITNGRSIPEILRLLIAMQTTDREHVVTPANWVPGQPALVPAPQTYQELLARQADPQAQGLSCEEWWWCYKGLPPMDESGVLLHTNQTPFTPPPPATAPTEPPNSAQNS